MGVYIKGLHKTKYCINCPLMMSNADGDWCALQDAETNESFKSWDDMRKHCPLVEVKSPHGDLIDRDAILSFIDAGHLSNPATKSWNDTEVVDMLESRPAVIEAEGKDDGNT